MPVCYLAVFTHPNQTPPQFNIEGSLRQALPFEPDHITDFQQTQACVWVWGKTPGVHLAPFVAKHDETLAVMSGYGLERGAEGVLGAKTFLRCGPQKFGEIWERFDGGWSGMVLNNTEVAAGSSCEGVEHVYYHQCDKYVIISNRGRLIWNLLKSLDEPLEPDWTTLGMLAALSYPTATNGTAVKNINLLLQHQQIHVKFDAEDLSVDVREHPRLFFINQSATKPPHTYKSSSEALSGHVRSLKNIQAPLRAALTGGKDSRLVLALLLSNQLETQLTDVFVGGAQNHADVLTAQRLAKTANLTLTQKPWGQHLDLPNRLPIHVGFTEGLLNAWDLKADTDYRGECAVHGLLGEIYRSRSPKPITQRPQVLQTLLPNYLDPLSVLRPEVFKKHTQLVDTWVDEMLDAGLALEHVPDAFYITQRIPRWVGQARLKDGLVGLHFNPLFSRDVLHHYYTLPYEDRRQERMHFELIKQLMPELLSTPLAQKKWAADMLNRAGAQALQSQNPIQHQGKIVGAGWQVPALRDNWPWLSSELLNNAQKLSPLITRDKLTLLLDVAATLLGLSRVPRLKHWVSAPVGMVKAKARPRLIFRQLYGLLTVLFLLKTINAPKMDKVQVA